MTRAALVCIRMAATRTMRRNWRRWLIATILRENPTLSTRVARERALAVDAP